jgi:hypothetical protein
LRRPLTESERKLERGFILIENTYISCNLFSSFPGEICFTQLLRQPYVLSNRRVSASLGYGNVLIKST